MCKECIHYNKELWVCCVDENDHIWIKRKDTDTCDKYKKEDRT
jgi:hypothetical protein